jgi:uncharacterized protein YdiU (UPF0061 family)
VTLDYGPFAFMERYMPNYNPWVGGGVPYSFSKQPQAAAINLAGLSSAFFELGRNAAEDEGLSEVCHSAERCSGGLRHDRCTPSSSLARAREWIRRVRAGGD